MTTSFASAISRYIWESRYRRLDGAGLPEAGIDDSWRRVAGALSAVEGSAQPLWAQRFFDILSGFRFLPGGRILAGTGSGLDVTLLNCFVMGTLDDSMEGIQRGLHEGAITLRQGGGVGYDFSPLRPCGAPGHGVDAAASGPVSSMQMWEALCATIQATGARRGAMMATLRCDHPDIERFIDAKRVVGALTHFNLSVLVTDAFVEAVRADRPWPLVFPVLPGESTAGAMLRGRAGRDAVAPCRVYRVVAARGLWERMLHAAYDCAEPGVLFIDRINRMNNLAYCEEISATNPCGEVPLPPYGACDLGALDLPRFVAHPFTGRAAIDQGALAGTVRTAVRLLDNVIDVSRFPLPAQAAAARFSRRIGLGVTGLADALVMLGLRYDSEPARQWAGALMRTICHEAYRASTALAREKGACAAFDASRYLAGPFVSRLPDDIRDGIARHGIRNSHLVAIAPTGTVSLLADNVSSGLEPIFAAEMTRTVRRADGTFDTFPLTDHALAVWRAGDRTGPLPPAWVVATDVSPADHVAMQAVLQTWVDHSISKTITVPGSMPFDAFRGIYDLAYDAGLKGCTTWRPVRGRASVIASTQAESDRCCAIRREGD